MNVHHGKRWAIAMDYGSVSTGLPQKTGKGTTTIRWEGSVTINQDCTENCFDPGVRHSGRSSLSGGGGHHFYLAVGVQEFRPYMNGS